MKKATSIAATGLAVLGLLLGNIASSAAPAVGADARAQLENIYQAEWQRWLREDPTLATAVGDPRYNDRWPDVSLAAIERSEAADRAALDKLDHIDAAALAAADRLTYDIVRLQFKERIDVMRFRPFVYAIGHQGNLQGTPSPQTASELAEITPFDSVHDYENWIARLDSFGAYVDQVIALLDIGVREHRTQACAVTARIAPQFDLQRVSTVTASPFYQPLTQMPPGFSAADRQRLGAAAGQAIAKKVLPAMARLERFFNSRYAPACRTSPGISATPDGAAFYRNQIAYFTTTDMTPEAIHELGLKEVARIHGEMDKVIAAVGFKGSFQEFCHFLRTDPQFFYKDPTELLHGYMVIAKSIDPNLVKLFGKLPRTPYGVRPIPDTSAPSAPTAYYQPPANDGSRAGYFYANLYRPDSRPKWEMETLVSHESVPGHHLQIALQYEQGADVPMIRRMAQFTAYVEGWGLYSESLGYDLGLYTDPYSKFGQLTYDMWRAVRLVVDTGIHSQGWTRQQAIDYFAANAPKSELDIANEIDRYISWPGQALAYKLGQRKIMELREMARQRLGEHFDIREFHDQVLATGPVPLYLLQRNVEDWIAAKSR
ncbi:MAG: DUF885 domain-containing protein [Steroidobacterales bacterium]